jgi:hypothetical protein
VHCEAFCASALIAAGYKCLPINSLIDQALEPSTFRPGGGTGFLLNHYWPDDPRVEIVHPVYDLEGYLDRHYQQYLYDHDFRRFVAVLNRIRADRRGDADLISGYRARVLAEAADA